VVRLFAFFTNAGIPALLLNPTIDVWDSALNHPINAQAMTEIAGGWYQYNFAAYNDTVDYVIRADGGAGLADFERYVFGSNECDSSVAESELNIRAGADTLDSLSDQLDVAQADLDTPNQYKADVAALAIEVNVEGHVTNSLNLYDPPTRAEATTDKDEIIIEVDANEVKIDAMTVLLNFINNIEGGRWEITGNQMLFYAADNVTLVATFNLFDSSGNPAEENVAERVRV